MPKKVLMIVGDFVEDYEAMVPLQILQTFAVQVDTVCPGKVAGDTVVTAIHDFEGHQTYSEKPGHRFGINCDWEAVSPESYDGLVLPGGRAPEYLQLDEKVVSIIRQFASSNKPIAVTCHGPLLLIAADTVRGKKCQAYPALRPQLESAGAQWSTPSEGLDSAITDGNLVSAPAWPANAAWMREFLRLLGVTSLPE